MNAIATIPLNKLVPSSSNVRKRLVEIPALAASLAEKGFLQNVVVKKAAKGKFEVVAGGRRLAAAKKLVADGIWSNDYPVPAQVIEDDATAVSLMENIARANMHIAEEIEAFGKLAGEGRTPEAIADMYGLSHVTVRKRQKLAALHPDLLAALASEEISLQLAEAYASTDDQEKQITTYRALSEGPRYNHNPGTIRHYLVGTEVEADSDLGKLVLERYTAMSGPTRQDLFEEEVYLTDASLIEQIKVAFLEEKRAELEASGLYKWIEVDPDYRSYNDHRFLTVYPSEQTTDQQKYDELSEKMDALSERVGTEEENSEALAAECESLEAERATLKVKAFRPEDKAFVGAMVYLEHGKIRFDSGLIAKKDKAEWQAASASAEGGSETQSTSDLSGALLSDLGEIRTAALTVELSKRPDIALVATVHALLRQHMPGYGYAPSVCNITGTPHNCNSKTVGDEDSPAFAARAAILKEIGEDIAAFTEDKDAVALFSHLMQQPQETLLALLAKVSALTVNVWQFTGGQYQQSQIIAEAIGLDMHQYWKPNSHFFARTSKDYMGKAILESEAKGAEQIASGLAKEKKAEAVKTTVDALSESGWLPEVFRA